jgi:hypothetical protein
MFCRLTAKRIVSATRRRNRLPAFSAEIPTGAVRSGFPINYLIIESLQKFHYYFGDDLKAEFPTGSNNFLNLWDVSAQLSKRLSGIFVRGENDARPAFANSEKFQKDKHWRDLLLFNEYFDGDTGTGLGASHQTGWTGLIAKLLQQNGE